MEYTLIVKIEPVPDDDESTVDDYESTEADALQEWLPELPDSIYVGDDLYSVDASRSWRD